jgi:hypothetical protein
MLRNFRIADSFSRNKRKWNHLATLSPNRPLSTNFEKSEADEGSKSDRLTNILMQVIDAKPRKQQKPSPEEAERRSDLGKKYVIGNFKRHNEIHHDLACKIRMKNHAIDLLPHRNDEQFGYLKEAALTISMDDDAMVPFHRPIPVDTPPIPNFDPSKFRKAED